MAGKPGSGGFGKMAEVFRALSDENIVELADSANDEDTVLQGIGLQPYQVKLCKRTKRWKLGWSTGKAKFKTRMNLKFAESKEPTIQKVIAEHTLPEVDRIEDGYEFEIDAPEWFVKGIGGKRGRTKPVKA